MYYFVGGFVIFGGEWLWELCKQAFFSFCIIHIMWIWVEPNHFLLFKVYCSILVGIIGFPFTGCWIIIIIGFSGI